MKRIKLTQGKFALISDKHYERVIQHRWYAQNKRGKWYALKKGIYLHRFILNIEDPSIQIDHIDGDGLNCQDDNLRVCTQSQNQRNRGANKNNMTGYKGVSFSKSAGRYKAVIHAGKSYHLGYFDTPEQAARAYDAGARLYHGQFAKLNFESET